MSRAESECIRPPPVEKHVPQFHRWLIWLIKVDVVIGPLGPVRSTLKQSMEVSLTSENPNRWVDVRGKTVGVFGSEVPQVVE